MAQPDFLAYTYGKAGVTGQAYHNALSDTSNGKDHSLPFVLEQKNGVLLHQHINLTQSVYDVLTSLVDALHKAGAPRIAPPPPAPDVQPTNPIDSLHASGSYPFDPVHWTNTSSATAATPSQSGSGRYGIHSRLGRDLGRFLSSLDPTSITKRRSFRMDVTAVALEVRTRYRFAAVDGKGLGWSSSSFAVLLQSLVDLHGRHAKTFHVGSFYPLRLVFSSEDYNFAVQNALDVHDGVLYLNPASTPLQWLDVLSTVTPAKVDEHKRLNQELQQNIQRIQSALDVRINKGHSCTAQEYHELASRLSQFCGVDPDEPNDERTAQNNNKAQHALTLSRVYLTVESPFVSRRATITKAGHIQIGASMSNESIVKAVKNLTAQARDNVERFQNTKESYQTVVQQTKTDFGLRGISYSKAVSVDEVRDALLRLQQYEPREDLHRTLTGNSLGIVGSGQFCHVGDDGSLVIPCDWK